MRLKGKVTFYIFIISMSGCSITYTGEHGQRVSMGLLVVEEEADRCVVASKVKQLGVGVSFAEGNEGLIVGYKDVTSIHLRGDGVGATDVSGQVFKLEYSEGSSLKSSCPNSG